MYSRYCCCINEPPPPRPPRHTHLFYLLITVRVRPLGRGRQLSTIAVSCWLGLQAQGTGHPRCSHTGLAIDGDWWLGAQLGCPPSTYLHKASTAWWLLTQWGFPQSEPPGEPGGRKLPGHSSPSLEGPQGYFFRVPLVTGESEALPKSRTPLAGEVSTKRYGQF